MKIATVTITANDLEQDCWDTEKCAGFRSISKVIPSLLCWIFSSGIATDKQGKVVTLRINNDIADKLGCHAIYQTDNYKYSHLKMSPVTFTMEVPDDVETVKQS